MFENPIPLPPSLPITIPEGPPQRHASPFRHPLRKEETFPFFQKEESAFTVTPRHKRAEGLRDIVKLLAGPILLLAAAVYRAVAALFVWCMNLCKPPSITVVQKLEACSPQGLQFSSLVEQLLVYRPKNTLESSGRQDHAEISLITLRTCAEAYKEVTGCSTEKLCELLGNTKLQQQLNQSATAKTREEILQCFVRWIEKSRKQEFISKVHEMRGRLVPPELSRTFEVEHQTVTHTFSEHSTNISCAIGAGYLYSATQEYNDQIAYIETLSMDRHIGIRPSQLQKESHTQGMTTNARTHRVVDADGKELGSLLRSGAFAVHDAYYPTETDYERLEEGNNETLNKLAKRWKLEKSTVRAEAAKRIARRRHLCIAQALPKVIASVEQMANKGWLPEQGFLHVEQSLLSDADKGEREMIRDMDLAIKFIRENVRITFTEDLESVVQEEGQFLVRLKKPENSDIDSEKEYRIHALFFSQGVNEIQSIGNATAQSGKLQDSINIQGLQLLSDYAESFPFYTPAFQRLTDHFSPRNKHRRAKDLEGVHCIAEAVESLGGQRGVACKSGKDRTSSEVNYWLSFCASRSIEKEGSPDRSLRKKIRNDLAGGISWSNTGDCIGKANSYAFNRMQYLVLPSEWKPPYNLCGRAIS